MWIFGQILGQRSPLAQLASMLVLYPNLDTLVPIEEPLLSARILELLVLLVIMVGISILMVVLQIYFTFVQCNYQLLPSLLAVLTSLFLCVTLLLLHLILELCIFINLS